MDPDSQQIGTAASIALRAVAQNGLSEVVRRVELCRVRHVHSRIDHSYLPEGL